MALTDESQAIVERISEAANNIKTTIDENVLNRLEDENIGFIEEAITEEVAIAMEQLAEQVEEATNGVVVIFDLENDDVPEDE